MAHEENIKEIMSVKESVYPEQNSVGFTNFNFDFLRLYKMYFQNCFANGSIKLASFTSHL